MELGDDELISISKIYKRVSRNSTYSMSFAQRANIEKSQGLLALEELHAGDFTCKGNQQSIYKCQAVYLPLMMRQKIQAAMVVSSKSLKIVV